MGVRHVHPRTRPFRYAGFWLLAAVLPVAGGAARSPWQVVLVTAFCALWPPLVDQLRRRGTPAAATGWPGYSGECALVALVLAWGSVPPLLGTAAVLCLLGGATALGGWRWLLPAAVALTGGAVAGAGLAPVLTAASSALADAAALLLMLGFGLALGHLAFVQARRLDRQRRSLAARSAALERLNGRMERYLPPSLRVRLARAPDAACRWERRWLTVVFVDLVGFTELTGRLEAEPLVRLLDDYLGALMPAADAHGGEVSKVMGDGVLVVFGLHDAATGDGGRRARAAAALAFCAVVPGLLEGLAGRWRQRGEPLALRARAGIASGYCTLGDRGGDDRVDFTLVGPPVNLASRLQARAAANGALLDGATAALAAPGIGLGPERRLELKGLGPVTARPLVLDGVRVDPHAPSAIVPAPLTRD